MTYFEALKIHGFDPIEASIEFVGNDSLAMMLYFGYIRINPIAYLRFKREMKRQDEENEKWAAEHPEYYKEA